MYIVIIYLFFFEFLLPKIRNNAIRFLKVEGMLNNATHKKLKSNIQTEILKLEKEVKELNKPSTFTEYVKKNRLLNKLKQQEYGEKDRKSKTDDDNIGCSGRLQKMSSYFFNLIRMLINSVEFMPMNVKKLLFFFILTIFIDESKYSVYIDPRLYSPFCQNSLGSFGTVFLNKFMSYGIALTIYDFAKYLIKLSYLNIKLNAINGAYAKSDDNITNNKGEISTYN